MTRPIHFGKLNAELSTMAYHYTASLFIGSGFHDRVQVIL